MLRGNVGLACNGRDEGEHLGQLTAGEPRIPDTIIHAARLLSFYIPLFSMSVVSSIFFSIRKGRSMCQTSTPAQDFLSEVRQRSYGTILADPPWQFSNRTGKMAPEHRRLSRYPTLTLQAIKALPVATVAAAQSHLYLWVPNALLREGLEVIEAWGFQYKTNLIWHKI